VTVEGVFAVTLLALFGVGGGLSIIGYRKRMTLMLWSGVVILIVVFAYVAIYVLLLLACSTGEGCL
jgi:hypothetical protein